MRYSVWDKTEKKFVDNVLMRPDGDLITLTHSYAFNRKWDFIENKERYVVSLCSKYTDKHGIYIYDGDIVTLEIDDHEVKYEVKYNKCAWLLINKNPIPYELYNFRCDQLEKIGNIFEDPELLDEVD